MPHKMEFYENKKGKSIGQIHPSELCFQSNIGSFFRFDIYRFVGEYGNNLKPRIACDILSKF
jgi:hypothetical protein